MRWHRRALIPTIIAWLTLTVSVEAADPTPAVVWYRASEECPSGADFLGKLSGLAARARLAAAGDHIDFVVTLVATSGATQGRLERQTQSGTVAIRELSDASCASVADALALSLGLALEPTQAGPSAPLAPEPMARAASSAAVAETEAASPAPSPAPAGGESPDVVRGTSSPAPAVHPLAHSGGGTGPASAPTKAPQRWSLGVDGGALIGVTPRALSRAAVFVDWAPALSGLAADLSFRLALVGALGSPVTEVGPIRHGLLAGRGEACPVRWGGARAGVRPCVAFELGGARASGSRASGQTASTLWAAPALDLRGSLALLPKLGLELGVGALVPLVRSEVDAGAARLYRAEFVALNGYFGISFGPF